MQVENSILHARLRNCLVTIVELEPVLTRMTIHSEILSEFNHLRSIIEKLSQLELSNQEVDRIESATNLFLKELQIPLSFLKKNKDRCLQ